MWCPIFFIDFADSNGFGYQFSKTGPSGETIPIFYGIQVLAPNGVYFGDVPESLMADIDSGVPGVEIATNLIQELIDNDSRYIYLIPPILKGGIRDYKATQKLLSHFSK